MTLENTLLQKLADWRPKGRDTLLTSAPTTAWTASITADRCETLGCQLWEVAVRRPASGQPLDLKVWAERLEQTPLLEQFKLIEVDDTRRLAQLRSENPTSRGEQVLYFELLLDAQGQAALRRYQAQPGVGQRHQVPFVLTHEVLARVVSQLVEGQ